MVTTTAQKPFYESIVDAIGKIRSSDALLALGELIAATKVPKNHEAIYQAFKAKANEFDMTNSDVLILVLASMTGQIQDAEEKKEA